MKHTVLFRSDRYSEEEKLICEKYFPVYSTRMKVPKESLVIGRYSVLPYYKELVTDLAEVGSSLINKFHEHRYIANFDWYYDIQHLTPRTYFSASDATWNWNLHKHGMFLKGRTNSAKNWNWMYAPTKEDFWRIDCFLHQHDVIASQGVVYREFIPLEILEKKCIPTSFDFVNEWRCFFYRDKLLTYGYYWSIASDETIEKANQQNLDGMLTIAQQAATILADKTNFFVVDVAKTADGRWIVIEVNDGQMSGLSMCDPEILYRNLSENIKDVTPCKV